MEELNNRMINRYRTNEKIVYKLNTPLFIIFFLFLLLNITSANIQAFIMVACSLYAIFIWFNQRKIGVLPVVFFILTFFVAIWALTATYQLSLYYFISELKIIILFTFPSFFYFLIEGLPFKAMMRTFFKGYVLMVLMVTMSGYLISGTFRDTGFLGFSIYISVSLVLFLSYFYTDISLTWKILTFICVFMLGSSNGLIAYFVLILLKAVIPIWLKIVPAIGGAMASYWYITVFRGRKLADGGIWTIDRVLITRSVINYTGKNFQLFNYLFGFGIGKPLDNFRIISPVTSEKVTGFINWYMSVNQNGVYPFSFHNEFLRIFYNFGFIGLGLILIFLYKNLNRETLIILLLTCLTNTIIYSTIGLFTLSFLIAVNMLEKKEERLERAISDEKSDQKFSVKFGLWNN